MKFTLRNDDETMSDAERRHRKSTVRSVLIVLAVLAVGAIVFLLLGCSTPDNDVIDQAIAARIYQRQ